MKGPGVSDGDAMVPVMSERFKNPAGVLKSDSRGSGRVPFDRLTAGWTVKPVLLAFVFSNLVKLRLPAISAALSIATAVMLLAMFWLFDVRNTPLALIPKVGKSAHILFWALLMLGLAGIENPFQPAVGSLVFETATRKLFDLPGLSAAAANQCPLPES